MVCGGSDGEGEPVGQREVQAEARRHQLARAEEVPILGHQSRRTQNLPQGDKVIVTSKPHVFKLFYLSVNPVP